MKLYPGYCIGIIVIMSSFISYHATVMPSIGRSLHIVNVSWCLTLGLLIGMLHKKHCTTRIGNNILFDFCVGGFHVHVCVFHTLAV